MDKIIDHKPAKRHIAWLSQNLEADKIHETRVHVDAYGAKLFRVNGCEVEQFSLSSQEIDTLVAIVQLFRSEQREVEEKEQRRLEGVMRQVYVLAMECHATGICTGYGVSCHNQRA
jgi:hypothetical protein